ncbi:MAG: hypothetical protein A3D64_02280 [Candidatus Wildermuthbacteria bacterium RIFCSPHIGHO2_02_FULL_49_9]|uniref:Uncharacterized protein n=2 Tax=Candidatus Wildermuthiibacteriota TaxID=1817923 RepID=A0A1G2QZF9_9BACT|nr:MAG: hypothetical protein A2672_01865 [Candidatus Wildermuthbacteria bacterium RIFCSPHIGHO2_01_FULL_49_22b]OHA70405.1 MAG: hypothetical protein A3D64_02280 [Candidatus Wildermuthbacteria bacterium RIFCSPHIGHO2_02_FULL_49_9]
MTKPLFSKSVRKHIRREKARIRREVLDVHLHRELIEKLLQEFLPKKKEESTPSAGAPKRRKAELAVAAKEK